MIERDTASGPWKAGQHGSTQSNRFSAEMCERLEKELEGDSKRVENVLANISGSVRYLSCDPNGCWLVQSALQKSSDVDAAKLAAELQGHVLETATSPHANYVLQKIVTQQKFNNAKFVAAEILETAAAVAQHRYGCRIICRLLEYHNDQELVMHVVDRLMKEVGVLCSHSFGRHVLESVIEYGHERHRSRVVQRLLSDLPRFAKHRHSSFLVEKAIQHSTKEDQESLLAQLLQPEIIAELALEKGGCYVAKTVVTHPKVDAQVVKDMIWSQRPRFQETKRGQHLLADLGMA